MQMKTLILRLVVLLLLQPAGDTPATGASYSPQDGGPRALSIETSQIEVDLVTQSIERTSIVVEGKSLSGSEKMVSEGVVKSNAVRVVASSRVNKITAFDTTFLTYPVPLLKDNVYVLAGPVGRYLLIAETDDGTFINPVEIKVRGPPGDDDDDLPGDPPPIGEPSLLEQVCRDALVSVTDPNKSEHVVRMALLYDSEAKKIESGTYSTVADMMNSMRDQTREILGDDRQGWEDWRLMIGQALTNLKLAGELETVESHAKHWRGIARGMR